MWRMLLISPQQPFYCTFSSFLHFIPLFLSQYFIFHCYIFVSISRSPQISRMMHFSQHGKCLRPSGVRNSQNNAMKMAKRLSMSKLENYIHPRSAIDRIETVGRAIFLCLRVLPHALSYAHLFFYQTNSQLEENLIGEDE